MLWSSVAEVQDGKPGRLVQVSRAYTPLNTCDLCGKIGTPKKVCVRSKIFAWNGEMRYGFRYGDANNMLCIGCWNKVKAIVKKQDEADECRTILRQIQRRITDERKNGKRQDQDNG